MKNNKLLFYLIVILILLSSGAVIFLALQNQKLSEYLKYREPLKINDKAYLFQRKDINGKKTSIKSINALLIFHNTTCLSCNKSANTWKKLYNKIKDKDIKIVGISSDPFEKTKKFVAANNFEFQVISDEDRDIFYKYRIKFIPSIIFVNKTGRICFIQKRNQNIKDVMQEIDEFIINDLYLSI